MSKLLDNGFIWFAVLAVALSACENRQAFRRPEPGLERMLTQPRGKAYGASRFFSDGRTMRMPPQGTVSREAEYAGDTAASTGRTASGYAERIPIPLSVDALRHGRSVFESVCATCHGILGDGVSFVAEKMEFRKPPSLFEARIVALSPGRTFEVITQGYGFMPSYAAMLSVEDRWAVIGYLGALRMSRAVKLAELPPDVQAHFRGAQP